MQLFIEIAEPIYKETIAMKELGKKNKNRILLERYILMSPSYRVESSEASNFTSYLWHKGHDSLLGMNVSIFQYENCHDANSLLTFLSTNNNILNYFTIDNSTYFVSDNTTAPENTIPINNYKIFHISLLVAVFVFLTVLSFFLFKKMKSASNDDTTSVPALSTTQEEENSIDESASIIDEYAYDENKYYRVVMYPQDSISDDQFLSDIEILKGRLSSLCNSYKYEFKKIDNHLCILIPIDAVDSIDSLDYLFKYYISPKFDVANMDRYEYGTPIGKEANDSDYYSRYKISHMLPEDIKNVSIGYEAVNDDIINEFCREFPSLGETDFPYNDSYPYVLIEYSDSFLDKVKLLSLNINYYKSFLGEILDNNSFARFNLLDYSGGANIIFPATMYSFSKPEYIENGLSLLVSDFNLGPLSSNYAFSITTTGIDWDNNPTGKYQCSLSDIPDEYCYMKFSSKGSVLSEGQMLDMKKYICFIMDSLKIPYALGHMDSHSKPSTYLYIACGYKNTGLPLMEMISAFSSPVRNVSIYDGYHNLYFPDYQIDVDGHSVVMSPSSKNNNLFLEYIESARAKGHKELYLLINNSKLLKTDLPEYSSPGSLRFDSLLCDCDSTANSWNFIENLFLSPDSPCSLAFEGAELIPLNKDMNQLVSQFGVRMCSLSDDTINRIITAYPNMSITYGEKYNGNLYSVPSGKIYMDFNLDVDDNFAKTSTELVKEISQLCDIKNNACIDLITCTLTEESFENLEQSKISVFRHYINIVDTYSFGDMDNPSSYQELLSEAMKETGEKIPVDYAEYYLTDYSDERSLQAEAGIYTAANMLGERMNSYKDSFNNIIINDPWFNYSNVIDSMWNYDYNYPFVNLE